MSENISIDEGPESDELAPKPPTPPKRGPGHRGQDVRDTMAEMAAKAHEISLEAGSKMAGVMREVISAAAGLTAFAIESARDLVQYMVRRGQMTQDEADKLLKEVESAHGIIPKQLPKIEPARAEPKKASASLLADLMATSVAVAPAADLHKPVTKKSAPSKPAAKAPPAKAASHAKPAAKPASKAAPKTPAKATHKAPVKKPAGKKK